MLPRELGAEASVTRKAIAAAARELRPRLDPTPLQHSAAFSAEAGCEVHLKLESVQPIRAFKVRGALNKVIRLHPDQRAAGLVTASNGNHGLGVAYAAREFGIPATVYVPEGANPLKVEAIRRLGASVVHSGRNYSQANAAALADSSGAVFVHAYDDADVIAGQGTVGLEIMEQLPDVDTVLVGVGGGGLIAGIAAYVKAVRPEVRVFGVEPAGADALRRSLDSGRIVSLDHVVTMADGLAASAPGELTFGICRRLVDGVHVVTEAELLAAVRLYFQLEHLLAEPAGAASMAGLLGHHPARAGERVAVVLSGANATDDVMIRALRSRQGGPG